MAFHRRGESFGGDGGRLYSQVKEALSIMLCAPVFIFSFGSSALLERPRCGLYLSYSLYLVYANFFHEKSDKRKSAILYDMRNGRRRLLGTQSINTESLLTVEPQRRASAEGPWEKKKGNYCIFVINLLVYFHVVWGDIVAYPVQHSIQLCFL